MGWNGVKTVLVKCEENVKNIKIGSAVLLEREGPKVGDLKLF